MGPITYSLCHTPVIGIVMFVSTLCAFPPPVPERSISLDAPGVVLSATFEAPLDRAYPLILRFTFPTVDARLKDTFVGGYTEECRGTMSYEDMPEKKRIGLGKPLALRVTVKEFVRLETVFDKTLNSLCTTAYNETDKFRVAGYIGLSRGEYKIDVVNVFGQPELKGIKTGIMLAGAFGGK
jgi:hypothetical protein